MLGVARFCSVNESIVRTMMMNKSQIKNVLEDASLRSVKNVKDPYIFNGKGTVCCNCSRRWGVSVVPLTTPSPISRSIGHILLLLRVSIYVCVTVNNICS